MIPAGYSFNLDGTCIYLTMATLFLAQATNTDLDALAATRHPRDFAADLEGRGRCDGLAGSSCSPRRCPPWARSRWPRIALILGVDRFMSEARALTNLIGNGVATVVVAKLERALDMEEMRRQLSGAADAQAETPETAGIA